MPQYDDVGRNAWNITKHSIDLEWRQKVRKSDRQIDFHMICYCNDQTCNRHTNDHRNYSLIRRFRQRDLRSRCPLYHLLMHVCSGANSFNLESHWLSRITFNDEACFEYPCDKRRRGCRRSGPRCNFHLIITRHTARQPGIMVWDGISNDYRTSLVVIRRIFTERRTSMIFCTPGLQFSCLIPGRTLQ